ncbi:hsp70 nucleotide exchange factor fes1 [Microsporum ferrugineum]
MDPSLNNLLKWSIENTPAAGGQANGTEPAATRQPIDAEALQRLLANTPSDAELMKTAMAVVRSSESTLENKLIAFDNFEQLVENLDNANNMDPLGLWPPLVETLKDEEAEIRKMAAWCVGTAVQNNEKSQEKALEAKAIPELIRMAREDSDVSVRRKAIYAISSCVRNYQPALDQLREHLPAEIVGPDEKVDAGDMGRIDAIIAYLKQA